MDPLVYILAGLAIGAILAWFIRKLVAEKNMVGRTDLEDKRNQLTQAESKLTFLQEKLNDLQQLVTNTELDLKRAVEEKEKNNLLLASSQTSLEKLEKDHTELKTIQENNLSQTNELKDYILKIRSENEVLKEKNNTIKKEIEEIGEKYTSQFKNLANEILEDKSKRFTEENQKNIKLILEPLNNDIKDFKRKVEETYEKENKQRFSLEEKIKDLVVLNQKISEEANNLTKALKGQRKTQGDWGEMILENILQESGLTEGREYFRQEFIKDEAGNTIMNDDGKKMQPDFILQYPDKRKVIIDSKVSLSAYERYNSSEEDMEQKVALQNHIAAIYNHVDELNKRNYSQFVKGLDFVMMFVPIEPAYLLAIQKDADLWNYAYKKRVILISPTNLIAAIKLISEIWKKEEQNKNAVAIAERGAAMYDKFVGFVENLVDVGDHIGRSQKSYEEAMKQLKDGSGNLIGQAEKLRKLGVQGKKVLPGTIINDAMIEDD
ncbi:MAG: DNA recombination protein RmuC [Chitinophagales bacterium]|nr:DNA recombination protein RmuC [Chitinophagales bacterium]MBP9221922.1 DNA recombination protein RmuC [Chitinophagales bacterium]